MPTNDAKVLKALGRMFWDMARSENSANAACGVLLSTPYLNDADRRFVSEQMRVEERQHDAILSALAQQFFGNPPRRMNAYEATFRRDLLLGMHVTPNIRFATAITALHVNEQILLDAAGHFDRIFSVLSPDARSDFAGIIADERGHVTWGRTIMQRIANDDPALARTLHMSMQYAKRLYPTVIRSAHKDWRIICDHFRVRT